jgi:hypothetical protein
MARYVLPEMSPWKRRSLTIPPDSWDAWARLAAWELWMGMLLGASLIFGVGLIVTAPRNVVTVMDFTGCYAVPPVLQPCERVAYRAGMLNAGFNGWVGILLLIVAAWLVWELWTAVAPKPITDEFLKLLDDSFGSNWRRLRTWPWARLGWAYGFTLVGAAGALAITLLASNVAAAHAARTPAPRVETSQHFRLAR